MLLRQFIFGLPRFRRPCGFQQSACFSIASCPFRIVCLIRLHFLRLIWIATGSSFARLHSSSLDITFGQKRGRFFSSTCLWRFGFCQWYRRWRSRFHSHREEQLWHLFRKFEVY
jgi:hypothetical protein